MAEKDSTPPVTLQVGKHIHHGWKGVRARLSLQDLAGAFSFDATDYWTENGQRVDRPIHGLDTCVLQIGDHKVVTGYVDDPVPFYRKGDVGLRVEGRDITARLLDCSTEKREFIDQHLEAIARTLCKDFGIPVKVVGWGGGKAFSRFTVDAGQSYARAIEDGCRQVGAMMWTDGRGSLLIGRPQGGDHLGALELGKHILGGEAHNSFAERFSRVTVVANKSGDDTWANAGDAVQGVATDPEVRLFRPLVVTAETQVEGAASPADRAAWEIAVRRARGKATPVTVQGWQSPAGPIYRPGCTLDIADARLARHGRLMISDVTFEKGHGNGTLAQLTLLPEDAFKVIAEGQSTKGGAW